MCRPGKESFLEGIQPLGYEAYKTIEKKLRPLVDLITRSRTEDAGAEVFWIQPKNAELIDAYVRKKKIEQIIKRLRLK